MYDERLWREERVLVPLTFVHIANAVHDKYIFLQCLLYGLLGRKSDGGVIEWGGPWKFIKVKLYESSWEPLAVYAVENDELDKTAEFYIVHLFPVHNGTRVRPAIFGVILIDTKKIGTF